MNAMASSSPFRLATPNPASTPSFSFSTFTTPQQQQQQQQQQLLLLLQQQQQQSPLMQQVPGSIAAPSASAQQQVHLFTNDRTPLSYQSKWSDVHPDSQQVLLQIEERILEYRDESRRLDQCERLYDTSALNKGFELDAARIFQELGGVGIAVDRERASLEELMKVAKDMLRNTEVAVRSFMILRHRFPRKTSSTLGSGGTSEATSTGGSTSTSTVGIPAPAYAPPYVDFYTGIPLKPSPFLHNTTSRFEHLMSEYWQWVGELERLLLTANEENGRAGSDQSVLQSLLTVMANVHDFFIYVAAEVESLHQQLESMRSVFLAYQRRRGDDNDPFLEADRREVAKREAAAKRVHPTLHVLRLPQPPNSASPLSGSILGSSFISGAASSVGLSNTPATSALTSISSQSHLGTSFSPFSSVSAPTQSLFGAPSTSAPTTSLFGNPASTPAPSLFGTGQTSSSIFGSTPLLGSTPAAGSTPSLFGGSSTATSASGALFGLGSATGAATAKAKPRGSRRK
ncbi:hypothetical protein O6H91_04G041000 [Diphasiastrum complanatum]|uniref:Uncharacterized protein n=1 Tax=Diphasiastrum complanatum TaxID=34168 RepID=A0ACC2DWF9_DIPCM|nr:hypothetical protein O6H91_04G041000 [Diphasiastrum complanatum]